MGQVVRKIIPAGIVLTVAGAGQGCQIEYTQHACCTTGDGGPAVSAELCGAKGLALGPDGSLYVAQHYKVRRVRPDGKIFTVAGSTALGHWDPSNNGSASGGPGVPIGDGGPATRAFINTNEKISVAPDGALLISDHGNQRIRRVGVDGIIETIVGTGGSAPAGDPAGDGGPALAATLFVPYHAVTAPNGDLLISDGHRNRIRRVGPSLPGYTLAEQLIPSSDASEVYVTDTLGATSAPWTR